MTLTTLFHIRHKPFARQVAVGLGTHFVGIPIWFVTATVTARWLGPTGKGQLGLATLLAGLLTLVLSGGVEVANAYLAGSRRERITDLSSNSVTLAVLAGIVSAVIVFVMGATGLFEQLLPGVPLWALALVTVSVPIALLVRFLTAILHGLQQVARMNLVLLSQATGTLALTLIFVGGFSWGLAGAILAIVLASAIGLAIAIISMPQPIMLRPRFRRSVFRHTLMQGTKAYVGTLMQFFNYRLDAFILNWFLGPASVGIYSLSTKLAEMLNYLPNAVGVALFPRAASIRREDMNRITPRVFLITVSTTTIGATALVVFGRPLILLAFSEAFEPAYEAMLFLLPGAIFLAGATVFTNDIAGRGYSHFNSINAGIVLMATVGLDLYLIPKLGLRGAAIATSCAYLVDLAGAFVAYQVVSRRPDSKPAPPPLDSTLDVV